MITRIKNGVLVLDRLVRGAYLYLDENRIKAVTADELPYDVEMDALGAYVAPGFIDIHTHGAGGFDFADGTQEDILKAAYAHAKHGTTVIYPTCTSSSQEDTLNFIKNVKSAAKKNCPGKPYIAGAHLEGPYFSPIQAGAQNPAYLKNPDLDECRMYVQAGEGIIRRVSFAPELPGSIELCRYLKDRGIVASFGHTDAIYEELMPAIQAGCTHATHLYSGMNAVTRRNCYRKAGAVETAFLEDAVTVEIISDGCHLPESLLKLIVKIKGPEKVCLITDSMRGADMGDGPSVLGPKNDGMDCMIHDGVAWLTDNSAFAGSIATADRLVRVMYHQAGVPLAECIQMMCKTPAAIMNLKDRGELKAGYAADVVFFDDDIQIQKVILQGRELE